MNKVISLVSIIIPCRNEHIFIGQSIESILANDFLKENMEILIVDGMSDDGTRDIIKSYCGKYQYIKLLDNTKKITPAALNIGIQNAKGDIIIRMDAHNLYATDYISKCVKYLTEYNVDNVGGVWISRPGADTVSAKAIALATSNKFGVGNAHYRTGAQKAKYVDTVPFGCYRKEVFKKIGLFDMDLIRNQDDEFNLRLIKNGGKILLSPDIVSQYFVRETYFKIFKMFYQYGYFKPLVLKKVKGVMTLRQVVPALFILSLFFFAVLSLFYKCCLWFFLFESMLYLLSNFIISLIQSQKNGIQLLPYIMYAFITIHFAYGIGYLKGILIFIFLNQSKIAKAQNIVVTR